MSLERRPGRSEDPRDPLVERLVRRAYIAWNAANDWWLDIDADYSDTGPGSRMPGPVGLPAALAKHADNFPYAGLDYVRIRKMVRVLDPGPDDVLYDLGCGKGRLLCAFARRPMKRAVGVEIFEELCTVARANAVRLRGRRAPVEVRHADAATMDYAGGTVFTLHYPFGLATTRDVLARIRASLEDDPRSIRIGYAHPAHEVAFEEAPWLEKYASFRERDRTDRNFWRSVAFWRNVPGR